MPDNYARIELTPHQAISRDGRALLIRMTAPKLCDVWLLASTERKRLDQLLEYRPGMTLGRRRR